LRRNNQSKINMENQKKRDARKILLALPLLMLPFLSLGFYALGGGSKNGDKVMVSAGINTALPDAKFKVKSPEGKIGFYEIMQADSAKLARSENYAWNSGVTDGGDAKAMELETKLSMLQKTLSSSPDASKMPDRSRLLQVPGMEGDVDRLELLMKSMQDKKQEDPEVAQLNSMLEKIIEIQNPGKAVKDQVKGNADREKVFAAVPALIAEKQKVRDGAVLKMILLDSTVMSSVVVPAGHELFGVCRVASQRLLVDIKTVRMGKMILPVDLSLYGMDGIRGLESAEAVVANAASGGADDAVRGLQVMGFDQSVGTQLAGAGIDAAKGLFSKKVKSLKVRVPGGIKVLLRDNSKK
jgi:hypothetical protein